ncbi:MAG: hypothetical protein AAGE94_12000 [Acidobacteriota bacterium]
MSHDELVFNGINALTGAYGVPPTTADRLADLISGEEADDAFFKELEWRSGRDPDHLGLTEGNDPECLDQAGWGMIVPSSAPPALLDALRPLLDHRREQAGERFALYAGDDGFQVGHDDKSSFLSRYGVGPGPVDPTKVPYYLMLVGDPTTLSWRFQTQLGVPFAVGRLDLGDDLDAYRHYAETVVRAETAAAGRAPRAACFAVANPDDRATQLSAAHLVAPVERHLAERHARDGIAIEHWSGPRATKAELAGLLGGDRTPSFLFSASHGLEMPAGVPDQVRRQGALLCRDWPGPEAWQGELTTDQFFSAADLSADADLHGLVGFFFACYGAGTPRFDQFAKIAGRARRAEIAPEPFVASLPKALLGHAGGGAQAVVGHVDRAWGCSFLWPGVGAQTAVFESTFDRLLTGQPVGLAVEHFSQRYAELATQLADVLEDLDFGQDVDPQQVARLWTSHNDARSYVVLGDPAVRVPGTVRRATVEPRTLSGTKTR